MVDIYYLRASSLVGLRGNLNVSGEAPPRYSAPPGFAINVLSDHVNIDWSGIPETGHTGYRLYRDGQVHATINVTGDSGTYYLDYDVVPGAVYDYYLVAYDAQGEGAATQAKSVRMEEPLPPEAGHQLGVLTSTLELQAYRSSSRKWVSKGDVAPNSPGDYDRIVGHKDGFVSNPSSGRWGGPSGTGVVPASGSTTAYDPPTSSRQHAWRVRDAAFVALIEKDISLAQQAANELMAQVSVSRLNFADRSQYPLDHFGDLNPWFIICDWALPYLFGYDYLRMLEVETGNSFFSDANIAKVQEWAEGAAEVSWYEARKSKAALFGGYANYDAGNYFANPISQQRINDWIPYYGETPYPKIARHYNNRFAGMVAFANIVGYMFGNTKYSDYGAKWVKEFVRFGVFPKGYITDFHRGIGSSFDDKGLSYAFNILAHSLSVAETHLRQGDPSVYDFYTNEGIYGSEGPVADGTSDNGKMKSLHFASRAFAKYYDGTYERYASLTATTDPARRINGINSENGNGVVTNIILTLPAKRYNDSYLEKCALHEAPFNPWPTTAQSNGPADGYQGPGGVHAGIMFEHAQDTTSTSVDLLLTKWDSSDRTLGSVLNGVTDVTGNLYISVTDYNFNTNPPDIVGVEFYMDDVLVHSEPSAPWDLNGGSLSSANPFDTSSLESGVRTLKAVVTRSTGVETVTASFTVRDSQQASYRINCGGSAVGDWMPDDPYISPSRKSLTRTDAIDMSATPDVPQLIFQQERYSGGDAEVLELGPLPLSLGTHNVRVFLAEVFKTTVGDRVMDVAYETQDGQEVVVVSAFDPGTEFGLDTAGELTFTVTDATSLTIRTYDNPGDSILNGVEILSPRLAPPHSVGGQYANGVVDLSWTAPYATSVNIYRNGTLLANTTGSPYTDSSVIADSSYSYELASVDAAGVESDRSAAITVSIAAVVGGSGTRLGSHFTDSMVSRWNERFASGWVPNYIPFTSPKQTITSNKDFFMANKTAYRFAPSVFDNSGAGRISFAHENDPTNLQGGTTSTFRKKQHSIRDAAFFYFMTGKTNTDIRNAVKTELLWMANNSNFDFSNGTKYAYGGEIDIDSTPLFGLNNAMSWYLHAYEYLQPDAYTTTERNTLNNWFYYAADYAARDLEFGSLNDLFVDRPNGNYAEKNGYWTNFGGYCYKDSNGNGPEVHRIHKYYNNRKATAAQFLASAASKLLLEEYVLPSSSPHGRRSLAKMLEVAKTYVKEVIMFMYFGDRTFGEFERGTTLEPEKGMHYVGATLGACTAIANVLFMAGDNELATWTTRYGGKGSECTTGQPDKSLQAMVEAYADYYAQHNSNPFGSKRYLAAGSLINDHLLDGKVPYNGSDLHFTKTAWFAMLTPFLASPAKITTAYKRSSTVYANYPTSPGQGFRLPAYMGPGDAYPNHVLQFMEMEDIDLLVAAYQHNAGGAAVGDYDADTTSLVTTGTSTTSTSNVVTVHSSAVGVPAALFQTERYRSGVSGTEIRYRFSVAPGSQRVRLYFAEIFAGFQQVGRIVDVKVRIDGGPDQIVETGIDVYAEVGGYTGIARTYDIVHAEAQIEVAVARNTSSVENVRLMGIEVLSEGPPPPPSGTLVYEMPLNTWGSGQLTEARLDDSGLITPWGGRHWERSTIMDDPFEASGKKVVRLRHRRQVSTTSLENDITGFTAILPGRITVNQYQTMIIEWDIAFGMGASGLGFPFWLPGGKLPGLIFTRPDIALRSCETYTGTTGAQMRTMWRMPNHNDNERTSRRRQMMTYAYWWGKQATCGDNYSFNIPENHFTENVWYRRRTEFNAGTPGNYNGYVREYLDDTLVGEITGLRTRSDNTTFEWGFTFHPYFGGADPSWGDTRQENDFYFRNVRVLRP